MELETLFTTSKWDILGKISQKPASPLQLSAQLSTTIANISQQIRLLEVAGLLDKEKISTRESGKPRTLFSVKNDFSYLIMVSAEGAKKALIEVSPTQRLIMNAWLTKDKQLESIAYRVQEQLADRLPLVSGVLRHKQRKELLIVSEEKLGKDIERLGKEVASFSHKVRQLQPKEFISQTKALGVAKLEDTYDILLLEANLYTSLMED